MSLETIVTSAIVSIVVSFSAFEYRFRRKQNHKQKQEVRDWYSESAELAQQVQQTWRRKYTRPKNSSGSFTGYDEVKKKMNLYATRLSGHASKSADLGVDENVVNQLEKVANHREDLHQTRVTMGSYAEFDETGEKLVDLSEQLQQDSLEQIS